VEQLFCSDAERIARLTEIVLQEALDLGLSDEDHQGGYLCVANNANGEPLHIVKLGTVKAVRDGLCEEGVKGDAKRLSEHPDHHTSHQSRCLARNERSGAVRAANHILAFRGLSEALNEAVMLVVARAYLGWRAHDSIRYCEEMAHLSDNPYYAQIVTGMCQLARFEMLRGVVHAD
jgi:hypothetical protein